MSNVSTRRRALIAAAGASALGAAIYSLKRYDLIPPDFREPTGIGETLTYATQRLLTSGQPLAREFKRSQISKVAGVKGVYPDGDTYRQLALDGFKNWHLRIEGLVARPMSFSLEDIKRFPAKSEILLHQCEEGWSYIAEWTGPQLSTVLDYVGIHPEARAIVFVPYPNAHEHHGYSRVLWESCDITDAFHPQTLLAYNMNGEPLSKGHGAPLRVRYGLEIGYKNTKYLNTIIVTNEQGFFRRFGAHPHRFFSATWYGGI